MCPECLHLHAALVAAAEESLAVHRDLRERMRSGEEVSAERMVWAQKACVTVADILGRIKEHAECACARHPLSHKKLHPD